MKTCQLIGSESDIGKALVPLMERDGYEVVTWRRGIPLKLDRWDLCVVTLGRIAPLGHWWRMDCNEWKKTFDSNLFVPINQVRRLWPWRKPDATVCFFAGSNPNMIMDGYGAYNVSKMALLKAVEQMDFESKDAKLFALGPGIVLTKIHNETLAADWPNEKLRQAIESKQSVPIDRIWACIKWGIEQPKEAIGGRNICVSDGWDLGFLAFPLEVDQDLFKLRRHEIS